MAGIKVYYNGACPVCRAGIDWQRDRARHGGVTGIEWIDVHVMPERVAEVGASLEFVREQLHVKDASGQVNVGADAFAVLFAATPGQERLAAWLRRPFVRPVAQAVYNVFAKLLYAWNRLLRRW